MSHVNFDKSGVMTEDSLRSLEYVRSDVVSADICQICCFKKFSDCSKMPVCVDHTWENPSKLDINVVMNIISIGKANT